VPIGIELHRQSILVNELIVGGPLRVADCYILIALVFFGDHPDAGRARYILGKRESGKEQIREETLIL
jgi:hypothetical protein